MIATSCKDRAAAYALAQQLKRDRLWREPAEATLDSGPDPARVRRLAARLASSSTFMTSLPVCWPHER